MAKTQSSKNGGSSRGKMDTTVQVAIIGGIVTIIATLITVAVPAVLKPMEATPISPTLASNSQVEIATTISSIPTSNAQTEISKTPSTIDDLVSVAMDNLNDVQVVHTETFDTFSEENWAAWFDSQSEAIDAGALKLTGQPDNDVGYTRINRIFIGGQGVILRFKYASDSDDQVHFSFDFGEMNIDMPKGQSFAIYDNDPPYSAKVQLHFGENMDSFQGLAGTPFRLDTWYGLLMVIGPKADLLTIIWDLSDPLHQIRYQEPTGNPTWLNRYWFFEFGLNKGVPGSSYIDDITEISFSSIK